MLWSITAFAQNNDRLKLIDNAKHDTTKARLYNELAWEIKFSNPSKSIEYANKALEISYKYKSIEQLSMGYKAKAHGNIIQKHFFEGLVLYDSAIYYAKASKNESLIAHTCNKKAGAMGDLGDFDAAIALYTQGLEAALKTNDDKLKHVLCNNLADAFQNVNKNTALTQKYLLLAIEYALKIKDFGGASLSSANLAKEYSLQKQNENAKKELKRTLDLLHKYPKQDHLFALTHNVIASVYEDIGEFDLAKKSATVSFHILDSLKMPDNVLRPLLVLGSVDFKMGRIAEAKIAATKLLEIAKERNAKIFKMESYHLLSDIAYKQQEFELALTYFKEYKRWNDSVFALDKIKNMAALEFKANLDKNILEAKLELKNKESLNKKLSSDISGLKIGFFITLLLALLISIFGYILYKSNKSKQKINTELVEKNQTIQQQASEKELLIQEIHHRVKNNLTMLQSLLFLQTKTTDKEEVRNVLFESQTRIMSMALVHQHLYENDREGNLNVADFLRSLLDEISAGFANNVSNLKLEIEGECRDIGIKTATPLGLIINELVTNSMKYAFNKIDNGRVTIKLGEENNCLILTFSDNGPGLAKPFLDYNDGFGFKIIRILSKQIKAEITYSNGANLSSFYIKVPYV